MRLLIIGCYIHGIQGSLRIDNLPWSGLGVVAPVFPDYLVSREFLSPLIVEIIFIPELHLLGRRRLSLKGPVCVPSTP